MAVIPHYRFAAADWPLALFRAERARAERLNATARRMLPRGALAFADRCSRRWIRRRACRYLDEITSLATELGESGGWALNLSYEWGCSSRAVAGPDGANRLIRVLDWPLHGVGRDVVAVTVDGMAGPWTLLTWPGYAGVVQASAPGRFAAAFNQAPLRRRSGVFPLDWLAARIRILDEDGLPPAHLLREVFEEAESYEEARRRLIETPIALPAIFILSGLDEGCIIERRERDAQVYDGALGVANHWREPGRDWPRGVDSRGRGRQIACVPADLDPSFAWLKPPVLNSYTRLAMVAEAASGRLIARGYEEKVGPATETFLMESSGPRSNVKAEPRSGR